MRQISMVLAAAGLAAAVGFALEATAQNGPPPQGQGQGEGRPRGPVPGYHLLPRFVTEQMKLSDDQVKQLAALETETKAKIDKILTADQRKILDEARPPRPDRQGPPGGGEGGPGGPGEGGGPDGPPPQ